MQQAIFAKVTSLARPPFPFAHKEVQQEALKRKWASRERERETALLLLSTDLVITFA